MNLNATIFAQMLIFAVVVWVTMKFLWPMITDPIEQRQKRIADGLAAAERGQKDLAAAESRVEELVKAARVRAQQIESAAELHDIRIDHLQRRLGRFALLRAQVFHFRVLRLHRVDPFVHSRGCRGRARLP